MLNFSAASETDIYIILPSNFFNDYSTGSDALWYLAQDASFDDEKYKNLISTSKAYEARLIKAIDMFNISQVSAPQAYWTIQGGQNGIGLALHF